MEMVLLCSVMYIMQRKLLYVPFGEVVNPQEFGLSEYQQIFITTSDNETLRTWYHKKINSENVILYFHGNAANLENRREKYKVFATESEFSVLAITYRGYPGSSGSPSEDGFYKDGDAAIKFLQSQGFKSEDIILYGESIGSGVATEMATRINAKALILESPFTSIDAVAKKIYWFLPVSFLLKDHFNNKTKIKELDLPILIIHGKKDKIVPISLGRELSNSYAGPKSLVVTEEHGHMDFSGEFLIQNIIDFVH